METIIVKDFRDPQLKEMTKERGYALETIQTQLLNDIASLLHSQIPAGMLDSLSVTITATPTVLTPHNTPSMPWMSFTVFNDGVGAIYMTLDEEYTQMRTPINAGENLDIDMHIREIDKVALVCLPGATADVRIFAMG